MNRLRKRMRLILLVSAVLIACAARRGAAHPFDETYPDVSNVLSSFSRMADEYLDDIDIQYQYADMLVMANELEKAEEIILKRVLPAKPDFDMAHYLLSEVYYRQKKFIKSLEPLRNIRSKEMKDDVLIAEATIHLKLGNPKKCLQKAREAMRVDGSNPGGRLHAGLAYEALGDKTKGMANVELSLRMDVNQPLVYDWLYGLYKDNLPVEERLRKLESFLPLAPPRSDFGIRVRKDISDLKNREKEKKKK